jgi:pSer/pThr/pTyr-binding forkhead associated (FHA) protein
MNFDTPTLVKLAREQPREEFVAALPYMFLVVNTPDDATRHIPIHALTVTVDSAALPTSGRSLEVLPLVKAPGSAHPERISIGRGTGCDVMLRDSSVSKLQACLKCEPDGQHAQLTDFESRNGTRVNGKALVPHQPTRVSVGDHVALGRVSCRLVDAGRLHDVLRTIGSLRVLSFKRD